MLIKKGSKISSNPVRHRFYQFFSLVILINLFSGPLSRAQFQLKLEQRPLCLRAVTGTGEEKLTSDYVRFHFFKVTGSALHFHFNKQPIRSCWAWLAKEYHSSWTHIVNLLQFSGLARLKDLQTKCYLLRCRKVLWQLPNNNPGCGTADTLRLHQ